VEKFLGTRYILARQNPNGAKMTSAELREARERLGLTQAELGARLGITKTSVYRMESGRQPILPVYELAVRGLKKTRRTR